MQTDVPLKLPDMATVKLIMTRNREISHSVSGACGPSETGPGLHGTLLGPGSAGQGCRHCGCRPQALLEETPLSPGSMV